MKTLKAFRKEATQFYTENASVYFAASYNKKMGGTQTIVFENGFLPTIEKNDKEFYSGRGAKYNNASMHEHINVLVTLEMFNEKVNTRAQLFFDRQKEEKLNRQRLTSFCKANGLNKNNYTDVTGGNCVYFERENKNAIELELNVNLEDFFNATGKTYYFSETRLGWLQFFHNRRQSYSFNIVTLEDKLKFDNERESWISAPYAADLGQTDNDKLFVC